MTIQLTSMRLIAPILKSGFERCLAFGENEVRRAQIKMLRVEALIEPGRIFDQTHRFFGSQPFWLPGKPAWALAGFNQDRQQKAVSSYIERHLPLAYEYIEKKPA